jgi:hypothetical protein
MYLVHKVRAADGSRLRAATDEPAERVCVSADCRQLGAGRCRWLKTEAESDDAGAENLGLILVFRRRPGNLSALVVVTAFSVDST